MVSIIEESRAQIADCCRRHGVLRLELVGSAARGVDFNPSRSDVDFVVEFEPGRGASTLSQFFALREELARVIGRRVDLLMLGAIENPFVRADLERSRRLVYAA